MFSWRGGLRAKENHRSAGRSFNLRLSCFAFLVLAARGLPLASSTPRNHGSESTDDDIEREPTVCAFCRERFWGDEQEAVLTRSLVDQWLDFEAVPAAWIACEKACQSLGLKDTPDDRAKELAIRIIEMAWQT